MNKPVFLFTFFSIVLFKAAFSQPFTVTTLQTPQQLVTNLTGPGVSTSNVSGQYHPSGAGVFINNGVQGFTIPSGTLLVTGSALSMNSPASYQNSNFLGLPGDPDIDSLIINTSADAAILEFDFQASSDSVELIIVFASEEYNDYSPSVHDDIFAAFITGPGYSSSTNVAVIPGTTIPISVNNINNGTSSGTSIGPCTNCTYYIDNVNTSAIDLSFDGFTIPIHLKFPVWPCSYYHMKLAVADVWLGGFDSAVMIEENSFKPSPGGMQIFHNGVTVNGTLTICAGGNITLTAPMAPNYSWNTGDTTQSILVTQPGTYSFLSTDNASSCFAYSDIVTIIQGGNIQTPVIVQNNTILEAPNVIPSPNMTWQWNLNGVAIPGAIQSTYTFTANGCYTVTIFEGTCESTSNEICVTNTSLYELQAGSINIYPHPVINTSVIETPFAEGSLTTLKLKDISGREVMAVREIQQTQLQLEKGSLRTGIYFLEISNSEYQGMIVRKILIQ